MSSKVDPRYKEGTPAMSGHAGGTLKNRSSVNPEGGRVEVTRKQAMVGSHRVGQDIELRAPGKLTPKNEATVPGMPSRGHENFSRSRVDGVDIASEAFVRGLKEDEKDKKTEQTARSFLESTRPSR